MQSVNLPWFINNQSNNMSCLKRRQVIKRKIINKAGISVLLQENKLFKSRSGVIMLQRTNLIVKQLAV